MCGHLEKVSRRAASLNMRALPLSVVVSSKTRPGSRPFSRSLIADAIDRAGMCLFCFFNSLTSPANTSFNEVCGSSRHIVFHCN